MDIMTEICPNESL